MKKKYVLILAVILTFGLLLGGCLLKEEGIPATLNFVYDGQEIHEPMTYDEVYTAISMFNEKPFLKETPTQEFSKDVSFEFEDMTFAFALDGSGLVKVLENGKYIQLNSIDMEYVQEVYRLHHIVFPGMDPVRPLDD